MKCRECRKLLVSRLEGVLYQREAALVAEHLESCPDCRKDLEAVAALRDRLLQDGYRVKAAGFTAKVMSNIPLDKDFTKVKEKNMFLRHPYRISLAAAAVIATVVALIAVHTPHAYAIEDTIEANKHITSIHFADVSCGVLKADADGKLNYGPQGRFMEGWLEYDDKGDILRLRMEYPITEDGPKTVVWQNGKATVWFKDKKAMATVAETNRDRLGGFQRAEFDPKLLMEHLKEAETKGTVKIIRQEPPAGREAWLPHVLIAEWSEPAKRTEVYLVDRTTNLLLQVDKFVAKGDEMVFTGRREFLDYNQPILDSVFVLNPPPEVMRIDETTQEIGMAKGNLSDNEVAKKAAREFFEALIAKDYAKAGQLLSGIPAANLKEMIEDKAHMRFLRVASIGEPFPMEIPGVGGVRVPCEVELESTHQDGVDVIPVPGYPDRWEVEPPKGVTASPTQETGLPKGDLSDKEIAAKVAHEYLNALVAKDFAKAAQLWGGIPASEFTDWANMTINVESVGDPGPREAGGFNIPCKIVMKGAQKFKLAIRPTHSHPDRWEIHGGF
jgi:hypothetical protein